MPRYHRGGLYARDLPFIAGQEGGGTIAAVSPKAAAEGFKAGHRVAHLEPNPKPNPNPTPTPNPNPQLQLPTPTPNPNPNPNP